MTINQQSSPSSTPPIWLPNGCPTWCDYRSLHRDGDCYDDRYHLSKGDRLTLTVADPGPSSSEAPVLDVYLLQHYRETGPRVSLVRDESRSTHLTLAETRTLIGQLSALLVTAKGDETAPIPGHPAWCEVKPDRDCGEYGHMSPQRKVGPALISVYGTELWDAVAPEDRQNPVIFVDRNEDEPLSLDEAESLAHELLGMVAAARAPQSEPNTPACPPWCENPHDESEDEDHWGDLGAVRQSQKDSAVIEGPASLFVGVHQSSEGGPELVKVSDDHDDNFLTVPEAVEFMGLIDRALLTAKRPDKAGQ